MPETCTCGAELPPDARFCHRCGRPQREDVLEIVEPQAPPPPMALPVTPVVTRGPGVNFHNPIAVRVGLTMASAAALLTWLPLIQVGFAVWWLSAGFFSVYLYHRRTGEMLTVSSGVRMGWVTGVLTFVIMTVLLTLTLVPLALRGGGLAAVYQEQLRSMQGSDAAIQQAMKALNSPAVLVIGIVSTLLFLFAVITCLCTAGGALGAKMMKRE